MLMEKTMLHTMQRSKNEVDRAKRKTNIIINIKLTEDVDRFQVRKNDAPEETGSSNKSGASMWRRKAEVDDLYRRPEHATHLYQQTHNKQ